MKNSIIEKAKTAAEKRTKELNKEFERSERGVALTWKKVSRTDTK